MNGPLRLTVLKPADLGAVMAPWNIVEGRSVLDAAVWRAAGWNYRALGVALTPPLSTRSAERRGTEGRGHSGSR